MTNKLTPARLEKIRAHRASAYPMSTYARDVGDLLLDRDALAMELGDLTARLAEMEKVENARQTAYRRAAYRRGVEAAAQICDDWMDGPTEKDANNPTHAVRIRALLHAK